MLDPRYTQLANVLVRHSVKVQPGEKILVEAFDIPTDFTAELLRVIAEAGGLPIVSTYHQPVLRALYQHATEEQMRFIGEVERHRMEGVQGYIGLRGSNNIAEMSDVPAERMAIYEKHWWNHVHSQVRVPKTKWVVLRWPSPSMAQAAGKSTAAFEDFYFRVCAEVDYARMHQALMPLKQLMERTDRVRITGPGTDLTFSIKGMPALPCDGGCNIPDGEIYTAPVRDSINGAIAYNTETLFRGRVFSNIRFTFKDGKIVQADAGALTDELNAILDVDEGARYIGEWALGVNPGITTAMKDTLFDEKINGSFHLTPGNSYDNADNSNRSQIHWDIVMIQTEAAGGGDIFFDDVLVRHNGVFVLPELQELNNL